jgi:hypothetical protein
VNCGHCFARHCWQKIRVLPTPQNPSQAADQVSNFRKLNS